MCLLSCAPKGTDKYSELFLKGLRNGSYTNTDGIGYSFKKDSTKKVFISKGYDKIEEVIEKLKSHKLKDEDELIVHQRIGNKGAKNIDMMHPFVLAWDEKVILSNNKYVDLPVIAHNGTFHSYSKHNSDKSDTFWFIQEFMHKKELLDLMVNDLVFFKEIFSIKLSTNRLALLFPYVDTNMVTLGEYIEEEGYLFSNNSYKDKYIRNVGGYEYSKYASYYGGSEDYDWDDLREHRSKEESFKGSSSEKKSFIETNAEKFVKNLNKKKYKYPTILCDEIIVNGGICVEDCRDNIKFRLFMDMWIPEKHNTESQFKSIKFNPTEFNYLDFIYKSITTDTDYGINVDTYYEIVNFDKKDGLHSFRRFYGTGHSGTKTVEKLIFISQAVIAEVFTVYPKIKYTKKYEGYYRLVAGLQPSKNVLKKINKMMIPNKYKEKENCTFKGINYNTPSAISLFQIMLFRNIFPKTYMQEIAKIDMVVIPS